MRNKNLSLGGYMGGKFFYRNWILQHLPKKHFLCFAEVFGGVGHVLFALPERLCEVEVYNDKWDDLVNLFQQLRNNSKALIKELKLYPYSRTVFYDFVKKFKARDFRDDQERAVILFYLISTSFNGRLSDLSLSKKRGNATILKHKISQLGGITERLQDVVIENMDFRKLIEKYDGPDTVFYCDPPYIDTEFYYTPEFKEKDHQDLADILNNIEGYAMVSYYDVPLLDELYPSKIWDRQYKEGVKHAAYNSKGTKKPKSVELLLLNYKNKRDFKRKSLDKLL